MALSLAAPATAAVIAFTDRPTFEAAAGAGLASEGFEGEPTGPVIAPAAFASGLVADVSGGTVAPLIVDGDPPTAFGYTNTTPGGANVLAFEGEGSYVVSFGVGLGNAFGFDLSGLQPVTFGSGGLTVQFLSGGILVESTFVADATDFSVDFHGFTTDAAFDEVLVGITTNTTTADFVAFDEVAHVPEFPYPLIQEIPTVSPLGLAALALLLVGAAFLVLRRPG